MSAPVRLPLSGFSAQSAQGKPNTTTAVDPLSEDKRAEAGITAAEAIQIGFAAVPGELDELELDTENSVLVWELDIYSDEGGRYELKIDATTGDIVQQKRDN